MLRGNVLYYLYRIGFLAFCAWGMHTPRLDLNDVEETRECARRSLAAHSDPLELQSLIARGDGRYTGEAVAQDGRVFQIEVSPESSGARIDVTRRNDQGDESRSGSGLNFPAFFREPPAWFETLCVVLVFGLLISGTRSADHQLASSNILVDANAEDR